MITLMDTTLAVVLIIVVGLVCLLAGGLVIFFIPFFKKKRAQDKAKRIIRDAEIKAEHITKNAKLDGKQAALEYKQEVEKELKERKQEVAQLENKLAQREAGIDRRDAALIQKETNLEEKSENLSRRLKELDKKEQVLQDKIDSIIAELEKVAQMSTQEARDELFARVETKISKEINAYIKNKEEEAKEKAAEEAKEIISSAMTRYSQDEVIEKTVTTIALPNDEMKGRIIGREGRNIRSFEQLLGVDLIIDDTPEVITISCFNPIRREIARLTLEYLIKDGRIQPGRIEELYEKSKREVEESCHKAGVDAAIKLGLPRINKELLDYVGKLKYRTSYGQNVLMHSIEVAKLCGYMAAELGLDQTLAKRAGLLHDIGKSIDYETDGSHIEIGAKLAKKYGEPEVVINAIESHHGDVPSKFVISNLVMAADTLSAARPGARSEVLENYIQRLEQLEQICNSYDVVDHSYALQSGRDLRIMVIPEKIDDIGAFKLAHEIRERIENEMTYPGQIKVTVYREYHASEIAK